jgi:hypothetical protein
MLAEAVITPLSSLPTAHPSPEAVRALPAATRRPAAPTARPSRTLAPRFTTTGAVPARAAVV